MDFLYYRPGESQQVPAELAYAFDRKPITHPVIANGPDGSGGILFAGGTYHERTNRVGVYRDLQTWRIIPSTKFWVGWYTNEIPQPSELARPQQIAGRDVTLGDRNEWTVPIAIAFVESADGGLRRQTNLPSRMLVGDDGAWTVGEVLPRYAQIYEIAKTWWDQPWWDEGEGLAFSDAMNWCTTVLQANYRIAAVEASILGLFDTENFKAVLNVLIDLETLQRRRAKKNAPSATLNSTAGAADSTQATDQPSLTS